MNQILTEQDLNEVETWNKLSPHRWCLIVTRARALLAQRDALKAERDEAIKERDEVRLRAQKAVMDEMRNNEKLTECRHALGGYAGPTDGISEEVKKVVAELEGCRKNMRDVKVLLLPESEGSNVPHTVIVERVKKLLAEAAERDTYAKIASESDDTIKRVTAERDTLAARVKELEDFIGSSLVVSSVNMREDFNTARRVTVEFAFCPESKRDMLTLVLKDNRACPVKPFAVTTTSTDVNPAKPGLQPMNCVCGGKIEFGYPRVGICQHCGASCRVMDPPPATVPTDTSPLPWCGYEADIAGYGKAWITRSSGGMYMWHAMVCGVSMEDDIMFGDSDRAKKVADKHVARYLAGKGAK